jgi:hypothetical protein
MKTGEAWVTGRLRVISEPKVDPAVGGKENTISGDEVVVNPAWGRPG